MESNGKPGRIQLSNECADLLIASGRSHWLEARVDKIHAKGKGELSTFWLMRTSGASGGSGSEVSESTSEETTSTMSTPASEDAPQVDPKLARLVSWNVQNLVTPLERIAALRKSQYRGSATEPEGWEEQEEEERQAGTLPEEGNSRPIDEVVDSLDIIVPSIHQGEGPRDPFPLDAVVVSQLEVYCRAIANMYNKHPFHSFEHGSHVLLSVLKLFSRIDKPKGGVDETESEKSARSYGLACDPLVLFACLLAALVHDVDHPGVSNEILEQENPSLSTVYGSRGLAEQNSFALSWNMLMDGRFAKLRQAIYQTKEEKNRFRALFLNAVMATDMTDEDRKRNEADRWERTFGQDNTQESHPPGHPAETQRRNRRATLVMEEVIRASKISHTMQHFQVYRKWNARLFHEEYQAYVDGRVDVDPSDYWFQQEIDFFDKTVIPLANRLQASRVFDGLKSSSSACSSELMEFAVMNRYEWETRGAGLVTEYREEFDELYAIGTP